MSTMRSYTAFPLDDDLLHEVLCYLPTFQDLLAALLTSKAIYNVYKTHPHAILLRVARNCIGPVGVALTAIRLEAWIEQDAEDDNKPSTASVEEHEEESLHDTDIGDLVKLGVLAQQWEDLYSWRRKDRTSQTSVLSSIESERFRTALYRVMIFHTVFQRNRFGREDDYIDSDSEEDNSDSDTDTDTANAAAEKRRVLGIHARKYLSRFSDPELLHIREFFEFYNSVWYWLVSIVANHMLLHYHGPRELMRIYIAAHDSPDMQSTVVLNAMPARHWEFKGVFFQEVFNDVAGKRKMEGVQAPGMVVMKPSGMLEEVVGAGDTCKACGAVEGLELWNESKWEHTRFHIPSFFPGTLDARYHWSPQVARLSREFPLKRVFYDASGSQVASNSQTASASPPTSAAQIAASIDPSDMSFTSLCTPSPPTHPSSSSHCTRTSIIQHIFDNHLDGSSYEGLTGEDWLCFKCLEAVLKMKVPMWIRDWQRDTNQPKKDDCWYGFWCRTQRHRYEHAQKLNHFCEPTRGEAS